MQVRQVEYASASSIRVRAGRVREDLGDVQALAESISKGLLHPIILDDDNYIIAGFRRYLAMRLLQWEEIPHFKFRDLPPEEKLRLELDENIHRKQFDWKEEAAGKARLHSMMVTAKGVPTPGSRSSTGWTIQDTAKVLNESVGKVAEDLKLSTFVDHKVVGQRQSRVEAIRAMRRTVEIDTMTAVAAALKIPTIAAPVPGVFTLGRIVLGSATQELRELIPDSVSLVLTDPPFGIAIDKSRWERVSTFTVYQDPSQKAVQAMLDIVLRDCWRMMRDGSYIFMFCPPEFYTQWRDLMLSLNYGVEPKPLIWYKQRGSLTDFFTKFAPAYETFLCGWKGDKPRPLAKPMADVFSYPRPIERWHKLERASGLLSDLIETTSAPNELVLDPFCGGGSTLAAAARLLRRYYGVESDPLAWAKAVQRMALLDAGQDDLADDGAPNGQSEADDDPKDVG